MTVVLLPCRAVALAKAAQPKSAVEFIFWPVSACIGFARGLICLPGDLDTNFTNERESCHIDAETQSFD
jgi:hypothetical protein